MEMTHEMQSKLKELIELAQNMGLIREMIPADDLNKRSAELLDDLLDLSLTLSKVFLYSPDSIYLVNGEGKTMAVNKAFEHTVGAGADEVIGRNLKELEQEGYFKPSVLSLVLKEKRMISVLQTGNQGEEIIATGVPITDHDGNIRMAVSNARQVKEIKGLHDYIRGKENTNQFRQRNKKEKIILASPTMKEIETLVNQTKDTDVTITITGPSGTGKSVLAKHIHDNSKRAAENMIEINCGAIPENLIESELFGYEGGAFTGANAGGKPGLIEAADKGTLFLDEVAELPPASQVKLLRVLQNKQNTRVGSTTAKNVDIRVIAATNQDLEERVKQGLFREDLYYRLNVIRIDIPPIKDRKEDILEATYYFLERGMEKYNRYVTCTKGFIDDIMGYEWPGNMRELENYIERSILTSKDGLLRGTLSVGGKVIEMYGKSEGAGDEPRKLSEYLDTFEGEIIRELYQQYKSSYKVAEQLDISQSKAYRLIRKYC